MIFKSKLEMFIWLWFFVVVNGGIMITVFLCIEYIPAFIWGIIIGCDAFLTVFVITKKYFQNRKELKKYSEVIKELKKKGVIYTALQVEKIIMSGYCFNEIGQIVRIGHNECIMPLSPGHRIILDRKGYPIEFDEYGKSTKEPVQKYLYFVIFMSVTGVIVVMGGFVTLSMFLPRVGFLLFYLFLFTLLFGTLYITRHQTPNSYIEHQKKWIRPQLNRAHEDIMRIYGKDIKCFVGEQRHFLHYYIMREGVPYVFISLKATVLPYKGICLYPDKREALAVFADRLHNNKISGDKIYFSPKKSIDYDLIRDIASFCLGVE